MIRRLRARWRQALTDLREPFDFDGWPTTDEPARPHRGVEPARPQRGITTANEPTGREQELLDRIAHLEAETLLLCENPDGSSAILHERARANALEARLAMFQELSMAADVPPRPLSAPLAGTDTDEPTTLPAAEVHRG